MTDFTTLDYDDPCATLAVMRPAYYQLLAGSRAQQVTFTAGNNTSKNVMFHRSDLTALGALIARLETQCAERSGRRRRFAIRAGGRIL